MNKVATAATFEPSIGAEARAICRRLGVPDSAFAERGLPARTPITGEVTSSHCHLRGIGSEVCWPRFRTPNRCPLRLKTR